MDKKLKMKWVKALGSGKYKQGRKKLKHAGRFCCLGVLKEIDPSVLSDATFPSVTLDINHCGGISGSELSELCNMNDNGKSFSQIAAWIRKHL